MEEIQLSPEEIVRLPLEALLPLRKPMSLLDRSVAMSADAFETEVLIRVDSLFCDGEKVGAWVGMEYMAQTVGVFANAENLQRGQKLSHGFLLGSREYRCKVSHFKVGSQLRIRAKKVIHDPSGIGVLECSVTEAGSFDPMVVANLTLFEVPDLRGFLIENRK